MKTQDKIEELTAFLYELDPEQTCCKENESLDEYIAEARELVNFPIDENLEETISEYFHYMFYGYLSKDTLIAISEKLIGLNKKYGKI